MDFWNVYEKAKLNQTFGTGRLCIASRDRIHLSLSTVERYSKLLGINQGIEARFSPDARYIMAKDVSHEVLVSLYDVNTTQICLLRFSQVLHESVIKRVQDGIRKLPRKNLEMRVIGMQDGDATPRESFEKLYKTFKPSMVEMDIFGKETRHIVFDTKLGMAFNLLLLNRIYRPGELATTMSMDEFNQRRAELKFL